MPRPASDPPSQADIRRRLMPEPSETHAPEPVPVAVTKLPRNTDPTRTPLPSEIPVSIGGDNIEQLRRENVELRQLIDQAIAGEEENERKARDWHADIQERGQEIASLRAQVELLQSGDGEGWL